MNELPKTTTTNYLSYSGAGTNSMLVVGPPAGGAVGCVVGCAWISLYSLIHAWIAGTVAPAAVACALQLLDGFDWPVVMRTGTFTEL